MSNERFKILKALYLAACRGYGSGLLYMLSPSTRGKSDTIKILLKDNPKAKIVRAGTNAFLFETLNRAIANGIVMFIVDDRTRWARNDFNEGVSYIKMLGEGVLCHLRGTKFSMEEDAVPTIAVAVLSLNYLQADTSYMRLQEIGFLDRALKLKVTHTDEEYDKILKAYRAHDYNDKNLPRFKMPANFYRDEGDKKIDPEVEKWINDNFKSAIRKTVYLIAMVTTKEAFFSLIPILECSLQDSEFKERIEFEENGTTKTDPIAAAGVND